MLVKWMTCLVSAAHRERFGEAQQRWWPLAAQAGFIGQIGGFDRRDPSTTCILALWADRGAYEQFMTGAHDRLKRDTGQKGDYESLHVDVGEVVLDLPGSAMTPVAGLTRARVLRVADCTVRPEREQHFRDVQQQVWAPAMARADGMLGGVFAHLNGGRYLVATGWRDQASHDTYQRKQLAALSTQADNSHDLTHLRGYVVDLRSAWTTTPGTEPSDASETGRASGRTDASQNWPAAGGRGHSQER